MISLGSVWGHGPLQGLMGRSKEPWNALRVAQGSLKEPMGRCEGEHEPAQGAHGPLEWPMGCFKGGPWAP